MMNKKFLQLCFSDLTSVQKEMLLALLADIDYTGFEETDANLNAYINEDDFNQYKLDVVLKLVPAQYKRSVIPLQNWNAEWESSFEPIIVDDFVSIRASFHQPVQHVQHEIIITPKMSFGTGHHATTYLMMQQISGIDFKGKSVLDFGTGTGVLSILSEKMGASSIDAIDIDDWSIENSIENISVNKCHKIRVQKADSILENGKYDIILANINLNVILENMPAIANVAEQDSVILFSGVMIQDEKALLQELQKYKIRHLITRQKKEWICIKAVMN